MGLSETFKAHVATGATCVARAWDVTRADGAVLAFTDHDTDLEFNGLTYRAQSGLTAQALAQSTGLSVDNTEALGALSSSAITETDIRAGRYDGAQVRAWLVNWMDPAVRALQFRGSIGEIQRAGAAFRADLRGLTEALNLPGGQVYQKPCAAVLGDGRCRVDLNAPGLSLEIPVSTAQDGRVFTIPLQPEFGDGWFARGRLEVMDGAAQGLRGVIKTDRTTTLGREVGLWEQLRADIAPGDTIRLEAGCDKRVETCKVKFANFLNFRGFPGIPGEDWLISYPTQNGANDGGSRVK